MVFQNFLPNTNISTQCEIKSLTTLPQFPDLLVFFGDRPSKVWKPCEVGQPSCAPIRKSVAHTFGHDLHIVAPNCDVFGLFIGALQLPE